MSYEILYRKVFIKVPAEKLTARHESLKIVDAVFLPLIETGSNNCWEYNNRRRCQLLARAAFLDRKKDYLTENEILQTVGNWRENLVGKYPDYTDKSFSYYSGVTVHGSGKNTTSFGRVKSFFQNGIKQAVSVERLRSFGIELHMYLSQFDEKIKADGLEIRKSEILRSTDELVERYADWRKIYAEHRSTILFSLTGSNLDFEILKRNLKEQARQTPNTARTAAATSGFSLF